MHTISSVPASLLQLQKFPCHKHLSITAATKPQPDGAGTATEGRRLYQHHFPFPIWKTTQISGSVVAFRLPKQALVAAAQGSLHFMLPANSHYVVTCRSQIAIFSPFYMKFWLKTELLWGKSISKILNKMHIFTSNL